MMNLIPVFPNVPATPPYGPEGWIPTDVGGLSPTHPVLTVEGKVPGSDGNVAGMVLYTSQALGDSQKAQARANIGAQSLLVSGISIKTVGGHSLLGSGNVPFPAVTWESVTGKPASFVPSAHSHQQSEVAGLETALSGKAASSHSHAQSDVTGLSAALAGKITDPGGTKTSGYVLTVDGASLAWKPTGPSTDGNAVHYTADAGKSDEQKAQARTNIGAVSSDDVDQKRGKLDLAVYGPSYDFSPVARSFDGGNSFSYSIVDNEGPTVYLRAFNSTYGLQLVATLNTLASLQTPIVPGDEYTRYEIATVTEDGLNLGIPVSLVGTILRMTAPAPTSDSLARVSQVPTSAQTASWTAKQDSLAWVSGKSYSAGDVVLKDGILYTCKTANSDTTWTPSKWESKCLPSSGGTVNGDLTISLASKLIFGTGSSAASIRREDNLPNYLFLRADFGFDFISSSGYKSSILSPDDSNVATMMKVLPSGASNWSEFKTYAAGETCWHSSKLWIAMQESRGREPGSGSMYWARVLDPTSFAVMTYGQSIIDSPTSDVFISFENDLLKMRDAPDGTTGAYNQLSMSIPDGNQAYFQAYYKGTSSVKYARLDRTGIHTSSFTAGASTVTEVTYGPEGVKMKTYSMSGGVRAASPTAATTAFAVRHDGVELESVVLKDTGPGRSGHKYRLSVYNGELTIAEI